MSKAESWKSWEGRVVDGKFPLRQWLGGSDHSAVFLTERPGASSQKIAIKLMTTTGGDERQLTRLQAAGRLNHPHLIRTFDSGRCQMDGAPFVYVVMECADDDLSQILPQRPLDSNEVAEMLPPVLDGLAYLHDQGFVHGRIKPSNLLAVGDQLKLTTDQVDSAAAPMSSRRRIDVFDAPETAAGIALPASDVWSLGAMLVAAFTQNVSLAEDGSQREPGLPQGIPEPFRGIVRECLHLDPKRRCSLKEIQARLQPAARSVPAPEPPPAPAPSPYRYSWRVFLPIVVLVVIALGWGLYRLIFPATPHTASEATIQTEAPSKMEQPKAPPTATQPSKPAPAKQPPSSPGAVLHQVLPDIPKSAMNTITGTIKVTVHVQVDSSGKVTEATFKSRGSSAYFARHALESAQRWEFTPPQVDGQPAASAWLLQFRFKRTSIQVSPQQVKR